MHSYRRSMSVAFPLDPEPTLTFLQGSEEAWQECAHEFRGADKG